MSAWRPPYQRCRAGGPQTLRLGFERLLFSGCRKEDRLGEAGAHSSEAYKSNFLLDTRGWK